MDSFVHLHSHTEYSLFDGTCRIKELVSYVKELGQTAGTQLSAASLFFEKDALRFVPCRPKGGCDTRGERSVFPAYTPPEKRIPILFRVCGRETLRGFPID